MTIAFTTENAESTEGMQRIYVILSGAKNLVLSRR